MNFYKHHLGDYDGHTAHLSWDEDMAYTRLIRAYYRREGPIPHAEAYRLCRATSKQQRAAVDTVLAEFFTREGDLWRQKRCDQEIAEFKESESERTSKQENERERQRRHRARRKELFEALREHGQVPAWDTSTDALESMLSACQSRNGNAPVTRTATANQNQNQINTTPRAQGAVRPEGIPEELWSDFLAIRKAKKAPFTDTAFSGLQREAAAAGITVQKALEVCCERGWQSFKASWFNGQKQEKGRVAI